MRIKVLCLGAIVATMIMMGWTARARAEPGAPQGITLGESTIALDGPWKFRTGDSPVWANPGFDDSSWENVDFKAPPGANDGDVGLPGYVPGWTAKGHAGYHGYAWYRIRLSVDPPAGKTLALLGPWAVDSVYQVYANGQLLGGVGDFSGPVPVAHGSHYPTFFVLPGKAAHGGNVVIAIRTWLGPWAVSAPGAGGIHIAPAIGESGAIHAQYRLQWLKIFEGYVVDAALGLSFFVMALACLCLWPIDRSNRAYPWLAAALVLSGIQRGNQAFFFWLDVETIRDFVYFIIVLVGSLTFAAWTMAWRSWFEAFRPAWLPKAVAALTVMLMIAKILMLPWLFHATFPHAVIAGLHDLITGVHLAFLLALAWIVFQGIRNLGREAWYALPAVLAIGVVLFAAELSALHVPGIWFPFGIGVSLGEYAAAVFDVLLFALLVQRLWSCVPRGRTVAPASV
jgi:hypothetical protein